MVPREIRLRKKSLHATPLQPSHMAAQAEDRALNHEWSPQNKQDAWHLVLENRQWNGKKSQSNTLKPPMDNLLRIHWDTTQQATRTPVPSKGQTSRIHCKRCSLREIKGRNCWLQGTELERNSLHFLPFNFVSCSSLSLPLRYTPSLSLHVDFQPHR